MFTKLKQYRKRFMAIYYSRTTQNVLFNAMHLLWVLLVIVSIASGISFLPF